MLRQIILWRLFTHLIWLTLFMTWSVTFVCHQIHRFHIWKTIALGQAHRIIFIDVITSVMFKQFWSHSIGHPESVKWIFLKFTKVSKKKKELWAEIPDWIQKICLKSQTKLYVLLTLLPNPIINLNILNVSHFSTHFKM